MDTATATITDFLLARIDDTENAWGRFDGWDTEGAEMLGVFVRADCEAKRHIVELHYEHNPDECRLCEREMQWPCDTLRYLVLPYVDHADYRQEWRP